MDRRAFLRAVGAAGAVGLSGLSGCVGSLADAVSGGATGEWRHDTGASVEAVADGRVFCRKGGVEPADDVVFALDAASGDRLWGFGQTGPCRAYTDLTVADAVYVGTGDDAIGNGSGTLSAREFDGEKRWTREFGSVYERPKVADGVVYVGTDDGVVRALDADDGAVLWRAEGFGIAPDVVAVTDAVYVADEGLAALDPEDGSVRWRYGGDDNLSATVAGGIVYVDMYDRFVAVRDGESLWSIDGGARFEAVATDYLFATVGDRVHAYATGSGERLWRSEPSDPAIAVDGDTVYVGGDRLAAVSIGDWTERWTRALRDGATIQPVAVSEGDDPRVYAVAGETRLLGFDTGGERLLDRTVDSDIFDVFVDDRLFLGAAEGVYAVDPSTETATE